MAGGQNGVAVVNLGGLTTSSGWTAPAIRPSTPLWTDDFTNLLAVMHFGESK